MNEKSALDFLLQIFYQCAVNENFFHDTQKFGVKSSDFANYPILGTALKFYKTATEKTYNAALVEMNFIIPENGYRDLIGLEELKLYYSQNLNYLRALELNKKITRYPENAAQFCQEFLENKTSTAKKTNLADAIGSFVVKNEEKLLSGHSNVLLRDFPCLSETIGGFNTGRVTIVTANTGFGKTNYGVNILKSAINEKLNCLYVNMEMDTTDMTKRFIQSFCHLRSFEFEKSDYIQKMQVIQNLNESLEKNWITDGSTMSINEICQMVSEIKRQQKLDFVIVDYDQKIIMENSSYKDEWQRVLKSVEMLEALSKKENVHVMMFAQTNDDNDGTPIASKRSMQPASAVIQFFKEGDETLLKFIKNRHGATSSKIKLNYDPARSLISENGYKEDVLPMPQASKGFKKRQDIYG